MYETAGEKSYHDIKYIRLNNTPNHRALNEKLASLENAEAALVTASGMAAISTTLLTLLSSGDHLLVQDCLYGGTHDLLTNDFPKLKIGFDVIDSKNPDTWKNLIRPETKAIYVETISNPLMQVIDLEAVVRFAQEHRLISIIDNTFATPINFRPPEWGFDLSLHSCTKYLNGHSDIVGGAVIGKKELLRKITHKLNHLGGSMDPHTCFLLSRGMKTLALRVHRHNKTALRIAQFLEVHPSVKVVNYPGLDQHPGHKIAERLFNGFGGMISFELKGGIKAVKRFFQKKDLAIIAPSLGGIETLITRPAATSHAGMPQEERSKAGISDTLIRISTGIEASDDIIEDLAKGL
jgi:cystathionine beta-lyase/cystathionine gamma-synthase